MSAADLDLWIAVDTSTCTTRVVSTRALCITAWSSRSSPSCRTRPCRYSTRPTRPHSSRRPSDCWRMLKPSIDLASQSMYMYHNFPLLLYIFNHMECLPNSKQWLVTMFVTKYDKQNVLNMTGLSTEDRPLRRREGAQLWWRWYNRITIRRYHHDHYLYRNPFHPVLQVLMTSLRQRNLQNLST